MDEDIDDIASNPSTLQKAFLAARRKCGGERRAEFNAVLLKHAKDGILSSIPPSRHEAARADFEALANGKQASAAKRPTSLADESFVEGIYSKWNGAKAAT